MSDPTIATVEILLAYLRHLPQILAVAALFDLVCWLVIWAMWRRTTRRSDQMLAHSDPL